MAGGKEIRTKIKSIQNTQKITKAMEMVAASKMRRAQDRMAASRPYSEKMRTVIGHLAYAHTEYRHAYLEERDPRNVGYIVVSSDRGLCGGLNNNMFRMLLREMKGWDEKGVGVELCTIGQKGYQFFHRVRARIVADKSRLGDAPRVTDVIGAVKVMLDKYIAGEIDRLFIVFNEFVNTMTQRPLVEVLLPLPRGEISEDLRHHWDYIYEPDAKPVLDQLMVRYIESLVYQGVVENIACEQAARMVAMKAASDNAGNLIKELQLIYNKARQAAITQELSEIVSGASAV